VHFIELNTVWGRAGCMESFIESKRNIEQTRKRVFDLLTQCIENIQDTVISSGFKMRDVGVEIEMYRAASDRNIVELKFQE
jgi:hypothetical protein